MTLLEASNGAPPQPTMVRPGLEDYTDALAERLTYDKGLTRLADPPGDILSKDQGNRPVANPAATALYSWIINPMFSLYDVGQGGQDNVAGRYGKPHPQHQRRRADQGPNYELPAARVRLGDPGTQRRTNARGFQCV